VAERFVDAGRFRPVPNGDAGAGPVQGFADAARSFRGPGRPPLVPAGTKGVRGIGAAVAGRIRSRRIDGGRASAAGSGWLVEAAGSFRDAFVAVPTPIGSPRSNR
jgi:hypothetical protein